MQCWLIYLHSPVMFPPTAHRLQTMNARPPRASKTPSKDHTGLLPMIAPGRRLDRRPRHTHTPLGCILVCCDLHALHQRRSDAKPLPSPCRCHADRRVTFFLLVTIGPPWPRLSPWDHFTSSHPLTVHNEPPLTTRRAPAARPRLSACPSGSSQPCVATCQTSRGSRPPSPSSSCPAARPNTRHTACRTASCACRPG
jgi:hypothetical protein